MARFFGTYGIRARLDTMTPEFAARMAHAFVRVNGGGAYIVGSDARTSSPQLRNAAIAGLMSAGAHVTDAGMLPSPALEFFVKQKKAEGGIIITASHNPPEWNAMKFVGREGIGLTKEKGESVEQEFEKPQQSELGTLKRDSALPSYISTLLSLIDLKPIQKSGLNVVIDIGNGAVASALPFFNSLGIKLTTLNAQADGHFPGRPSEPTEANLANLIAAVKSLRADLGIAFDGDGDRVIFIDENGRYIWGDKTFALCAKIQLATKPKNKAIFSTVATSDVVKDVAEKFGGKITYTKVGAPYLAEAMSAHGAALGGEEVGGVIWPQLSWGKDGLLTAAKILEEMARTGKPLSSLIDSLPTYYNAKGKIDVSGRDKNKILEKIKSEFSKVKGAKAITIDGVRLNFSDGWVIIRPSGTEPYFRIFAEAKSQQLADERLATYKKVVEQIVKGI